MKISIPIFTILALVTAALAAPVPEPLKLVEGSKTAQRAIKLQKSGLSQDQVLHTLFNPNNARQRTSSTDTGLRPTRGHQKETDGHSIHRSGSSGSRTLTDQRQRSDVRVFRSTPGRGGNTKPQYSKGGKSGGRIPPTHRVSGSTSRGRQTSVAHKFIDHPESGHLTKAEATRAYSLKGNEAKAGWYSKQAKIDRSKAKKALNRARTTRYSSPSARRKAIAEAQKYYKKADKEARRARVIKKEDGVEEGRLENGVKRRMRKEIETNMKEGMKQGRQLVALEREIDGLRTQ